MNKDYVSTSALYGPYLAHHGIKGQKWGIRRYQNADGTLTEEGKRRYKSILSLDNKNNVLLAERKTKSDSNISFSILENGKKIGNLFLENHGKDLYVNWLDVNKRNRGRGIATSVMKYVDRYAKARHYTSISLEVPSTSPDARHIYEKLGYKSTQTLSTDDIWGGLTEMRKKVL